MKSKFIPLIWLLYIGLSACDSDVVDMQSIYKEVNKKINNKIKLKIVNCDEKAYQQAEIYVDSIIAEITKDFIKEEIDFPEKPQRDTDSKNYQIKIDSINIEKLTDSLKLNIDSLK